MIKVNDRFMTGAMYAPFCRTKHAPMEEWDKDMKNMAELGYTCLHGFAEWHDIEYKKGVYDFTKIDYFVECAVKNGLVPIVNVATQNSVGFYSPRWLMEELRGKTEGFVDSNGQSTLQGEYVVPCLDDPEYKKYSDKYLEAVAKHFACDKRVGAYVLWGEPTLFSPKNVGAFICYCKHTKAKFRRWLAERYDGDIEKLNEAWGNEGPSFYSSFDEVNPPTGHARQLGGFNSWDDFREFMEDNLASHIKNADRIFKENGAAQPTIVEMLPGINNGIDPWKLAKCTDIIGISLFGRPSRNASLFLTVSDSISKANGKCTFVIEAGGGTVKFDNPSSQFAGSSTGFSPLADELKTAVLMRAGYGTKGLMYWCWRPRLSDTEGNDFGMCRPDGKPLKRTVEVGKLAKRMDELSGFYNSASRKSDVAVFMSQAINHIMAGDKMDNNYLNALVGANFMMTDLHINSDFINDKEVENGSLSKYKVLILPCTYIISEKCAEKIAEFVNDGGTVIADYILAEKRPGGVCYTTLPGAGLNKVFGIDREDVFCVVHSSLVKENSFGIGLNTFVEELNLEGAKPLEGEYMTGYTLLTENDFGKGKAYYIATQYFKNYALKPEMNIRKRVEALLEKAGVQPYTALETEDKKSVSTLVTSQLSDDDGKTKVITVTNTDYPAVSDTMIFDGSGFEAVEMSDNIKITEKDGKTKIDFTLGALASFAVYKKD